MAKDTPKDFEALYRQKLKEKNGLERALMGFSMFATARSLVNASLSENLTAREKKIALFDRFYGGDFDQETRDRIITHLEMQTAKGELEWRKRKQKR